jgi:transposase
MTREEAITIYRSGEEATVTVLLELSAALEKLTKRVEKLEEALARKSTNSSNSSKPPSSDGITKPPGKRRAQDGETKRKPGGQKGHKGVTRKLFPEDEVTTIEKLYPKKCKKCGSPFPETPTEDMLEPEPRRHQQLEIPPKSLIIDEYQRHGCRCSCGTTTWAELPPEAVDGFGPRLAGSLAYLTGCHRISRRGNHEIAEVIHGLPISPASVCGVLDEAGQAVEETYEELACALPDLPFVNGDESSWRVGRLLSWLWIFAAPMFVVFRIGPRSSKTVTEMLGETFGGVLCCDRFGAYLKAHKGVFQFCWAHLIRNFKGLADTCPKEDARKFSRWMLAEAKRLFEIWHRFRGGDITRSELIKLSVPIRSRIVSCLKLYSASETAKVRKFATKLLACQDGLFTFLYQEGVEPTNNSAEQGVRPAVMWRKICQGNKTQKGARITERLLTVTQTCRIQGIDPIEFLAEAILAYRRGLPAPSLLPKAKVQFNKAA